MYVHLLVSATLLIYSSGDSVFLPNKMELGMGGPPDSRLWVPLRNRLWVPL